MHLRPTYAFLAQLPWFSARWRFTTRARGFTYIRRVGTFYYIDQRRWRGPKISDKAASTHVERIEESEHVGEGWRALQDVSKVKLKASYSFSLCSACIYAWPLSALIRARSWFTISFDPGPWSLQFGSAKRSCVSQRRKRYFRNDGRNLMSVEQVDWCAFLNSFLKIPLCFLSKTAIPTPRACVYSAGNT